MDLLTIDDEAQRRWGMSVLRPGIRIVLGVHAAEQCSIKDAEFFSRLSNRGFQVRFDELIDRGLLVVQPSKLDRRRKLVSVTGKGMALVALLNGQLGPLSLSTGEGGTSSDVPALKLVPRANEDEPAGQLGGQVIRLR